jgi:hypothetical protein
MNSFSTLIGVAGFEWNRASADAAHDALWRRKLGEACHNMVLLNGQRVNRQKR